MRIYLDTQALAQAAPGDVIELPDAQAHHVARVMRRRVGDVLSLFDGHGHEWRATLTCVDRKRVEAALDAPVTPVAESPLAVHLGQAISKGDRMDIAIQKSVEMGVSEITPLYTERGDVRLKGEREAKKLAHWQAVAISACEQCGRATLPRVHPPQLLSEWLAVRQEPLRLVLQPGTSALAQQVTPSCVALLIGPEGGFAPDEIRQAQTHAFGTLTLGPRILRTETAPIAALTLLQYLYGDLH